MFVFVFSLLVLQCAFALPTEEKEATEWVPSRMAYARDFDRWFNWVPWGGSDDKKPAPSIKERLRILETRQKVLFDLVRCESYDQSDCSPFRTQAETVFEAPAKQQSPTPPTKVLPAVTPAANQNQEQSTAATTAAPVENSSAGSTAAPAENTSTEPPQSTTVSTQAASEDVTDATTPA